MALVAPLALYLVVPVAAVDLRRLCLLKVHRRQGQTGSFLQNETVEKHHHFQTHRGSLPELGWGHPLENVVCPCCHLMLAADNRNFHLPGLVENCLL